jgi:hypothetical protein
VLADLGKEINIMPIETTQLLQLITQVRPTPIILELFYHSTIKPEGVINDLVISVDSWEYLVDFVVLQPKTHLGGHPLILGRPWLSTTESFIGCRYGSMTISDGYDTKKLTLYPHATPSVVLYPQINQSSYFILGDRMSFLKIHFNFLKLIFERFMHVIKLDKHLF